MNIQQMMKQAQSMQKKMQELQKIMDEKEITGTAGGGAVTIITTGKGEVKKVKSVSRSCAVSCDWSQVSAHSWVRTATKFSLTYLLVGRSSPNRMQQKSERINRRSNPVGPVLQYMPRALSV